METELPITESTLKIPPPDRVEGFLRPTSREEANTWKTEQTK